MAYSAAETRPLPFALFSSLRPNSTDFLPALAVETRILFYRRQMITQAPAAERVHRVHSRLQTKEVARWAANILPDIMMMRR
jgi:hypothetical protein